MRGWAVVKALPMLLLFTATDETTPSDGGVWPPGTVFPRGRRYRSRGRVLLRGRAIGEAQVPATPDAPVQATWTSRGRLDPAMSLDWGHGTSGRTDLSVGRLARAAGRAVAARGGTVVGKGSLARPHALGKALGGRLRRSRAWLRRRDETAVLLALLD